MSNFSARVFDRRRHGKRRDRAAARFDRHAFLKDRIASAMSERLSLVNRSFGRVLDLGAHSGQVGGAVGGLLSRGACRVHADLSHAFAERAPEGCMGVVADEEELPFARNSFDLVISGMSLHWVNDLPGSLVQIRRILLPDGLFMGSFVGGSSLCELRRCFLDAEMESRGGASQRVSPFADALMLSDLLQRAGFVMPVSDVERIEVKYASAEALLEDLRGMGETASLVSVGPPLTRRLLSRALQLYEERHVDLQGRVGASFDIVSAIGWSPGPDQPHPGIPGFARSGSVGPGGLA